MSGSDKRSSIIKRFKKGTLNVFGYRKSSKPGNKLRKPAPSMHMTSEPGHACASPDDQASQVNSPPHRVSSEPPDREKILRTQRQQQEKEQDGTSPMHNHPTRTSKFQEHDDLATTNGLKKPRPLTPMKATQGQNKASVLPAYRQAPRLSPLQEQDSPVKTDDADRPFSPTPMKASRGHGRGDGLLGSLPCWSVRMRLERIMSKTRPCAGRLGSNEKRALVEKERCSRRRLEKVPELKHPDGTNPQDGLVQSMERRRQRYLLNKRHQQREDCKMFAGLSWRQDRRTKRSVTGKSKSDLMMPRQAR
ncbi:hypothetical protein PMIN06_006762 [Paraphaeosphaeria minitans]